MTTEPDQSSGNKAWLQEDYQRLSDRQVGSFLLLSITAVCTLMLFKAYMGHLACLIITGIPYFLVRYFCSAVRIAQKTPVPKRKIYAKLNLAFSILHSAALATIGYALCKQPYSFFNFIGFISILIAIVTVMLTTRMYQLDWMKKTE